MKTDESDAHQNLTHHYQHQQMNLNLNFNNNTTIQKQHQQLCSDDKQSMMMTTDDLCANSSMDKNKESLKVKLMLRRPIQQLIEQGIIPRKFDLYFRLSLALLSLSTLYVYVVYR